MWAEPCFSLWFLTHRDTRTGCRARYHQSFPPLPGPVHSASPSAPWSQLPHPFLQWKVPLGCRLSDQGSLSLKSRWLWQGSVSVSASCFPEPKAGPGLCNPSPWILYSKKGKVCAPSKATDYSALAKLSCGRILPIYLQPKRALWLTSSKVPCLINSNNSRCCWVLSPWGSLC